MLSTRQLALTLLVGAAAPVAAAAAPGSVRLIYEQGPDVTGCPDEQSLRDSVSARLGYDPFNDQAARIVRVRVEGTGDQLFADVRATTDEGKALARRVNSRSGDCHELASAIELSLTIAIDPLVLSRPSPPAAELPPPPPPPPAVKEPLTSVATPLETPREQSTTPELAFFVGPVASTGAPKIALGINAGVELRWNHFSIGLEGKSDLPAGLDVSQAGSVSTWTASGTLVPCVRWEVLGLCALAAAGAQGGYTSGLAEQSPSITPLVEVGARALATLQVTPAFSFRFHLDARVPLARTTLFVRPAIPTDPSVPVWNSPTLAAVFGISAVGHLGL